MIFNSAIDAKLSAVHESVKQLHAHHSSIVESLKLVEARVAAVESKLHEFSAQKENDLQQFVLHLSHIQKTREDVEKSTRSFADVQRKIERSVDEQLASAINSSIQQLKLDAGKYDSAKKEIEQSIMLLGQMNHEIAKFHAISKDIKQGDFQLAKYAQELRNADNERVRLLKQVDDLQRLVAKMRRVKN